jgi:hypothetical protein
MIFKVSAHAMVKLKVMSVNGENKKAGRISNAHPNGHVTFVLAVLAALAGLPPV